MQVHVGTFTCSVTTPDGQVIKFVIGVHSSESSDERLIEPGFYLKFSSNGQVPEGVHHEMEVLAPETFAVKVHRHQAPSGRWFVCWTSSVPTLDDALWVTSTWCVGAVFTMLTGQDFGPEFMKNPSTFVERMQQERGIITGPLQQQSPSP